jgi:hypothetical protein
MFVKDLVEMSSAKKAGWSEEGRSVDNMVQQNVFRKHMAVWNTCSDRVKRRCEKAAAIHQSQSRMDLANEVDVVQKTLAEMRTKQEEEELQQPPLSLAACAWSAEDMSALQDLFDNPKYTDTRVAELRASAERAAEPLPLELQELIASVPVYKNDVDVEKPHWLPKMAYHRNVFSGTALEFDTDEGRLYFKFMFAMQNPLHVAFSRLFPRDDYLVMTPVTSANWEDLAANTWLHHFTCDFLSYVPWHDLPRVDIHRVSVLRGLEYMGGTDVFTDDHGTPLGVFLMSLPEPEKTQKTKSEQTESQKRAAVDWRTDFLRRHPWLAGSFERDDLEAKKGTNAEEEGVADALEEMVILSDDELDAVFRELLLARERVAADPGQQLDFKITLLGGKWTKENRDVAFDATRGAPRANSSAEDFAVAYGFKKSARFEIGLYGLNLALVLARTWCSKVQYYFDVFESSGQVLYRFTDEDHRAWHEPAEFTDSFGMAAGLSLRRMDWLRRLRPRL